MARDGGLGGNNSNGQPHAHGGGGGAADRLGDQQQHYQQHNRNGSQDPSRQSSSSYQYAYKTQSEVGYLHTPDKFDLKLLHLILQSVNFNYPLLFTYYEVSNFSRIGSRQQKGPAMKGKTTIYVFIIAIH